MERKSPNGRAFRSSLVPRVSFLVSGSGCVRLLTLEQIRYGQDLSRSQLYYPRPYQAILIIIINPIYSKTFHTIESICPDSSGYNC